MNRLRMVPVPMALSVLTIACALLTACGFRLGVRDYFSSRVSCPPSKVTVVSRPDYRAASPPEPTPPADIAADPTRLAFWRSQRNAERKSATSCDVPGAFGNVSSGFVEANGCGQRLMLCCTWAPYTTDQGVQEGVSCHDAPPAASPSP